MIVVTVARRPLAGSVAETVLKHEAGALNIDATRIAPMSGETIGPGSWSNPQNRTGEVGGNLGFTGNDMSAFQAAQAASVERANRMGRWPANLVLGHLEGCRLVGTLRVKSGVAGSASHGFQTVYVGGEHKEGTALPPQTFNDADGLETVDAWECVEGCPVADLDGQGGHSVTGHRGLRSQAAVVEGTTWGLDNHMSREYPGETGGAARFFKQVRG